MAKNFLAFGGRSAIVRLPHHPSDGHVACGTADVMTAADLRPVTRPKGGLERAAFSPYPTSVEVRTLCAHLYRLNEE